MSRKIVPVRQHIRLLDKPIWTPSRNVAKCNLYEYISPKERGYSMENPLYGLPTEFDRILLAELMRESQSKENAITLHYVSVYALLKAAGKSYGSKNLELLKTSLKRWKTTWFTFTEPFYSDEEHKRGPFHRFSVIESLSFKNGITIKLNENFVEVNNQKYSRLLELDKLKLIAKRGTPFALRLYELLLINMHHGHFRIGLENLLAKMAVEYNKKYRSRILKTLNITTEKLNEVSMITGGVIMVQDNGGDILYFLSEAEY
jgi:hypothetical protein